MANIVLGKITGRGPVRNAAGGHGADVAFLDYDKTSKPKDLPENVPFLRALPMDAMVDMDTLDKNWVLVTNPPVLGVRVYCELPRFTPTEELLPPSPPVSTGKKYKVELTISGTISEIEE